MIKSFLIFLEQKTIFPNDINDIIFKVLKVNNFSKYYYLFKNNIVSLPLVINLLNYSAKTIDDSFYDYKSKMIFFLIDVHNYTWGKNGIVYSETPMGQVSFHVFNNEDRLAKFKGLHNRNRKWSKIETQFNAPELIQNYIDNFE